MEKIYLNLLLLFLTGCIAPIMTTAGFDEIAPGTSITAIEAHFGAPYAVNNLPNGLQEYIYIQRTSLSSSAVDQLSYVLYVSQGKVISKRLKSDSQALFLNYY
ncbi:MULTISPECIES: hypothetical protein [unclassified Neochlamydia]|uniref:hypothetical protein n=1 Tax=unclassified Neochlamydia TaxID=2643326 RepID=UPI001BC92D23|nr:MULTISPECIES: hypothetical protein [unclassified Neochlamydia]